LRRRALAVGAPWNDGPVSGGLRRPANVFRPVGARSSADERVVPWPIDRVAIAGIPALTCRACLRWPCAAENGGRFVLAGRPVARENVFYKQGVAHGRSCDNISFAPPHPLRLRAADFHD
jgi:hypothetical protein